MKSKQSCACYICFGKNDLIYTIDSNGLTPLIRAADNGHMKCLQLLIKAGDDVNKLQNVEDAVTPLMKATGGGNVKCVKLLLKSGADVNLWVTDNKRKNDLMKDAALYVAVVNKQPECVKLLIEAGADVNIRCNDTSYNMITPLLAAIKWGTDDQCAEILVNAGADVNTADLGNGDTVLICAVQHSSTRLVELILKAGANVNAENSMGNSALNMCILNHNGDEKRVEENIRLLFRAGAYINKKPNIGHPYIWLSSQYINPSVKTLNRIFFAAGEKLPFDFVADEDDSLKDMCRRRIRQVLIDKDPHENLFVRIPGLGLPSLMAKYLLYCVTLDD